MQYEAHSLTEIAEQFDKQAKSERELAARAKLAKHKSLAYARAVTWESAAEMLRKTTLTNKNNA